MDTLKELFVIIIAVGCAALFIKTVVSSVITSVKNRSSKEQLSAKLKEKTEDTGVSALGANGLRYGKKAYRAVFETSDGERELLISEEEYKSLEQGATGTLYCRGGTFLGFIPDSLARSTDDEKN